MILHTVRTELQIAARRFGAAFANPDTSMADVRRLAEDLEIAAAAFADAERAYIKVLQRDRTCRAPRS